MNIFLWILQILLALHTVIGAVWKFSNSEQTVPSLQSIPHGIWLAMSIFEIFCAIGLILPAFNKRLGILTPIAATYITVEMLFFSVMLIFSGGTNYGHLIYWFVMAAISAFIAYGRFILKPLQHTLKNKL